MLYTRRWQLSPGNAHKACQMQKEAVAKWGTDLYNHVLASYSRNTEHFMEVKGLSAALPMLFVQLWLRFGVFRGA